MTWAHVIACGITNVVADANLAGHITGKTWKKIRRLCCDDVVYPGNMLIHKENVIWEAKRLCKPFCICGLWDLENPRLYLSVITRIFCNWGNRWEFVFFLLLLPLPFLQVLQPPQPHPVFLLLNLPFPSGIIFVLSSLSPMLSTHLTANFFFPLETATGLKTP